MHAHHPCPGVPDTFPPQKIRLNDYDDKFKGPGATIFLSFFLQIRAGKRKQEGKGKLYQNRQEKCQKKSLNGKEFEVGK